MERVTRKNKGEESKIALTISAQYGLVDQETFFNNKVASSDLSHYYLLVKGDYAYNKSYSSGYPWGAVKRLNLYEKGAVSTLYICFRPFNTVDSDYIGHYFESKKWHKEVSEIAVEGARNHGLLNISVKDFFETLHFVPSITEQKKIAALLTLIDERIATQNKIIDKLKSLIKGLSQQLLSPENDWILYRLDDLAQIKSGYSGTQVGYQTPYKVSRIETISKHCVDTQRIGYVECISECYKLNVGDILFSNINSVQYIGNTAYIDKDYGLYHGMNLLRIIPNTTIVRPRFLHLLLCTDWAINHFQTICNKAVSQASINQTALGKSRFQIPPMSIQKQICSMFELTERKLDNEQKCISHLQQQKWYLLQEMFI
ncbi:restriction endonuclease subunit S [Bacteroides faecichinchillae]|uniref:restriction endonuclease subunit S n=1 Tax=Bacteroides faecichinchillae TaxID=871325 RepID=UPI00131EDB08|nr:restriction endonuclease subunit S [Bacteroides faecichinchillae]